MCLAVVVSSNADVDSKQVSFFLSCRFMLAIIGFFVFLHLYAQRIGMSVAIVCMLNQTALDELESLQTANVTKVAETLHNATEARCSRQLADGTVDHTVGIICYFLTELMDRFKENTHLRDACCNN